MSTKIIKYIFALVPVFFLSYLFFSNTFALTTTSVTRTSAGINFTWTFNCNGAPCQYGQFATGDYWVVPIDDQGNNTTYVTITSITPNGEEHGAWSNPVVTSPRKQGILTGYATYDATLNVMTQLPYNASPGESIGKIYSKTSCFGSTGVAPRCVATGNILTILSAVPANNGATVFRPPWHGTWKPLYTTENVLMERLPEIATISSTPGLIGGPFGYERWTVPQFELNHIDGTGWSQEFFRATSPDDVINNYGADQAKTYMTDLFTVFGTQSDSDKAPAVYSLMQKGIDNYAVFKMGVPFGSGAGQHQGKKPPIAFFAAMYDDPTIIEEVRGIAKDPEYELNRFFQEDSQIAAGYNGNAIWTGEGYTGYTSELSYWTRAYPSIDNNGAGGDPYGYIDGPAGGPSPDYAAGGRSYLGTSGGPHIGYAFAQHLMPWLKYAAGDPEILNWSDRIYAGYGYDDFDGGFWASPDPCAAKSGVYGVNYGPDPEDPGDCIRHNGDPLTDGRLSLFHGFQETFLRLPSAVSLHWDTLRACADPEDPSYRTGACVGLGPNYTVYNDTDNDGVSGVIDQCPNTPSGLVSEVNQKGCVPPNTTGFDIVSDLSYATLDEVDEFTIGKEDIATIEWTDDVDILSLTSQIDLASAISVSTTSVSVNTDTVPGLDVPAVITLYDFSVPSPMILKDGVACVTCEITFNSGGVFKFTVEGFSEYEVVENVGGDITTGLVRHFNFESQNGADLSTNNVSATLINTPTFVEGVIGDYALQTNGSNSWMQIDGSHTMLTGSSNVSYASWVKTTSTTQGTLIGAHNSAGNSKLMILLNRAHFSGTSSQPGRITLVTQVGGSGNLIAISNSILDFNDGEWHHIAVTVNLPDHTFTLWLDGELVPITYLAQPETDTQYVNFVSPFGMGATNTISGVAAWLLQIAVDDARFYTRALDQDDVDTLVDLATPPDITAPVLSEITPVSTPTSDTTPSYTFSTTEGGTIIYGGACSSATTAASVGNNTITFTELPDGIYNNCKVWVTDASGNTSTVLNITSFTVDTIEEDITAPVLSEITPVSTPTSDTTPSYTFSTTEGGFITYGGSCSSTETDVSSGSNTIAFNTLTPGTYSNCTIMVTDSSFNESNTLNISAFTISIDSASNSGSELSTPTPSNGAPSGFFGTYQNISAPQITPQLTSNVAFLQNQVFTLQAQLDALLSQVKQKIPVTNTIYSFERDLRVNMTGTDVQNLQKYLNTHGFILTPSGLGSPGNETNLFGALTYKALIKFQKSLGLPATGFFGPMTRGKILEIKN